MKWGRLIRIIIVIVVLIGMYQPFMNRIKESRLDENHCLEEEMFYYRVEGGFLVTRVKTTKEKADGVDYNCIKWEEKPSFGAIALGQDLIYEKGSLSKLTEEEKDDGR